MKKINKNRIILCILSCIFFSMLVFHSAAFGAERSAVSVNARAYGYYVNGDYKRAVYYYKRAIKSYPTYAPSYDGLANVYLKQGNYGQAYLNYTHASKLDPDNSLYKIHAHEAIYASIIKNISESKNLLKAGLSLAPENPTIRNNAEKLYNGIFKDFDVITDIYQNPSDINLTKGNLALWGKKYQQAINFYINSIKAKPNNYLAYTNLGLLYFHMNKNNNAEFYYKKAVNINPRAAYALNNLGVISYKSKNINQASKYFDQALKVDRSYTSAKNNKAACLVFDIDKKVKASKIYVDSIAKNDTVNLPAIKLLGNLAYLDKDYETAINAYKLGLEIMTDDISYMKKIAEYSLYIKQYQQTIEYCSKIISLNANDPETYTILARTYEKNGDAKNALANYQTAIRLNSAKADTYKYYGYFLVSQKREKEGREALKKYLDLSPNPLDLKSIQDLLRKIS